LRIERASDLPYPFAGDVSRKCCVRNCRCTDKKNCSAPSISHAFSESARLLKRVGQAKPME
jgi:hypothetical protein